MGCVLNVLILKEEENQVISPNDCRQSKWEIPIGNVPKSFSLSAVLRRCLVDRLHTQCSNV